MYDRYSKLFEPVKIGPVVAPNRFYQVPHCNGMGYRMPKAHAEMRRIKAEGGWGVVCTEEVEIHHSSDLAPGIEGRLWDEEDIPSLALIMEAVHQYGALAGIELTYSGHHASNLYSRAPGLGPRSMGVAGFHQGQTRRIEKQDILEEGTVNVIVATGARWRKDGIGRKLWKSIEGHDLPHVFTPDDLMAGKSFSGQILIFDDDHYYMSSVLAELLHLQWGDGPWGIEKANLNLVAGFVASLPEG